MLLTPLAIDFAHAADPPVPTYGAATVDGDTTEWDLSNDFFANMYRAGDPDKDTLAKLYLRYDCSTETLYALVLAESGVSVDVDPDDNWIKVYALGNSPIVDGNDGNDGTPPDFAWVGLSGTTAKGWEASAPLAPGEYSEIEVHANVNGGETSSTGKQGSRIPLSISCTCLPTLYFESDPNGNAFNLGQIIDDEYAAWGVQVTTNDPTNHPAMIFDSSNPTGGDDDLGTPNEDFGGPGVGTGGKSGQLGENKIPQGKILIISEDNDPNDPDDKGDGGTITFTFNQAMRIDEVHVLDIDENGSKIQAFDAATGGNLIREVSMQNLGDNSFQIVPVNVSNARRLEIIFAGSGGIPAVVFCRNSMDFGDLPEPAPGASTPYPTTHAKDGARHLISNLKLGNTVDTEDNGQPESQAGRNSGGDDHDATPNDEDGVVRTPGVLWQPGKPVSVTVTISGGDGCLSGWIDWNNDGDFDDTYGSGATEHIISKQPVSLEPPNPQTFSFKMPTQSDIPGLAKTFYARFRLVPRDSNGQCSSVLDSVTGGALGGEVEDYFWEFGPTAITLTRLEATSISSAGASSRALSGAVAAALVLLAGGATVGSALVLGRRSR